MIQREGTPFSDKLTERLSERGPTVDAVGGRLTVRAVKLFADGALGSHGARLLEPYHDRPSSRGLAQISNEDLEAVARLCRERGYQLCVHAIGDAANRSVLDVFEKVLALPEGPEGDSRRFRVEHAQVVDPRDRARFSKLGVIASMQPVHATTDMRWAERRLGSARLACAYAWKSLAKEGVRLALGSDFPVEPESPLLGLYAAVTRQSTTGDPRGGFMPQERLTPEEALAAYTEGPAFASFAEHRRGRLEPGMDADLTILSEDPLELLHKNPARVLAIEVVDTYVGGVPTRR
jgi:predicted amidohydrolase YtcJ